MPRILIVDDEKAIRKTMREILEYEGYTIDEAEDGQQGADIPGNGGFLFGGEGHALAIGFQQAQGLVRLLAEQAALGR